MPSLLVNIDVPDIDRGVAFYTRALGLRVGRRLGAGCVELVGAEVAIYLLEKAAGTRIGPGGGDTRRYDRHWSPVHLDLVVDGLENAVMRAKAAGAVHKARR